MSLQNENSVERGSRSKKKKSRGFDGNQRCDSSSTSASSEVAVAPQQQWNTAPWQCQLANSKQRLTCMLESSRLHDQVFTFNDGSSIKAHRLLLAMCSPVFEAMFFGPNSEGPSVHLPEDPPEAFAWILRYCYTDHVSLPNVDTALQIYQLAHRYQMDSLVAICKDVEDFYTCTEETKFPMGSSPSVQENLETLMSLFAGKQVFQHSNYST
ncbi:unnamed protein product, partial [Meganyctiphanes norvegica]